MTKYVTYVYVAPYGPRDFMVFKTEAAAYRYQQGMTAQGRPSSIFTTTGNSHDEHQAELARLRAELAARVAS